MEKFLLLPLRGPLLCLLCALTSCFPTELPPLDTPPAVARLDALADGDVALSLDTQPVEGVQGYQYLTVFPVTRVYTPSVESEVTNQAKIQLGLKGYRVVAPQSGRHPEYQLDLTVEEFSVSGYCYLLFRRPSAFVSLKGTLRSPEGEVLRECSGTGKSSFTARFAFAPELNEARRIALTDAMVALVDCFELKKPRPSFR
jgi:hypothetical protein